MPYSTVKTTTRYVSKTTGKAKFSGNSNLKGTQLPGLMLLDSKVAWKTSTLFLHARDGGFFTPLMPGMAFFFLNP